MPSVLVVDDEVPFLQSVERSLRLDGFRDVVTLEDPRRVADVLEEKSFDVALLDISMPQIDGLTLLRSLKERAPATECIMVTANSQVESVVQAVKLGAYDYLLKPTTPEELSRVVERALERKALLETLRIRSSELLDGSIVHAEAFAAIITRDERMVRLLREAELHADSNIPVLVTGETGVGKELLARAIHDASRRASAPFVPVNMMAIAPALFESEFFGHVRGAFTGAGKDRGGYLAHAHRGTLFLDEIGDLSLELQGKLLRILQEGEYTPVGSTQPRCADIRVVAATHRDLEQLVQESRFRKDLFYRLQFANLALPPLRERRGDIPVLAAHFLESRQRQLADEALDVLVNHDWPGNVRQLKGVLEAAANLAAEGVIRVEHLSLPAPQQPEDSGGVAPAAAACLRPLAEVERDHILQVYHALEGNKTRTARTLGIGLMTLRRRLEEYGES